MNSRRCHESSPWSYYPLGASRIPGRARPRAASRRRSKRGAFGKSWWAKRWIAVLESFDIGARWAAAAPTPASGQVLSIDVARGQVTAKVQGSRPKPYDVTIEVKTLPAAEWDKLLKALAGQALFAAKLLAGEMPQDIEEVFKAIEAVAVSPAKHGDLTTACSCPDWSNPCKHIAAVYYLLGEEFDRDPFLIFRLRGMTRDELLAPWAAPRSRSPRSSPTRRFRPPRSHASLSPSRSPPRWSRSGMVASKTTGSARWRSPLSWRPCPSDSGVFRSGGARSRS